MADGGWRPEETVMLFKVRRPCWGVILPAVFLLPVTLWAAEFSAQLILKDGGKTMPGKIYVQDGKMRQEFQDEEGQTVTIVRPDKKVIWIVVPQEKTYGEMPLKTRLPGQFLQMPPDALKKLRVGTETVNGYVADKYEVTVKGGKQGVMQQTIWVAQKLGLPIKMNSPEQNFSLEYRNIREGKVAEHLFAPPPGFRKMTSPIGFTMRVRQETE